MHKGTVNIAVIDLYDGAPNQGLRCLRDQLKQASENRSDVGVAFDFFDTRHAGELPDINYDIFISSGGPGSPYDGQGLAWEKNYFNLVDRIYAHNQNGNPQKKYIFFICHSFQMMVRFFGLAEVVERHSESFGIFPLHKTAAGRDDPLFHGLADPFYGSDFRNWQVIQPNRQQLKSLGAKILCMEKIRPHVPYERAVMAVRVSAEMVGTQFHPESDPASFQWHLHQPEKKNRIIEQWGMAKYRQMQELANNADTVARTQRIIIPGFINYACRALRPIDTI
ncbi:MAG: GMP synthase [Desulfosarcina sp.]|nr:GMP synthase [Desulfosarcina sp.]